MTLSTFERRIVRALPDPATVNHPCVIALTVSKVGIERYHLMRKGDRNELVAWVRIAWGWDLTGVQIGMNRMFPSLLVNDAPVVPVKL